MGTNLIATASTFIAASPKRVWRALITPAEIKQYMFGTTVASDWREGHPITWSGEWKGKAYQDKGVILRFVPEQKLQYSHFSPLAGLPDEPANYHTVTIELTAESAGTRVVLTQDGNATEAARDHSAQTWSAMLDSLKRFIEHGETA
jgi:uncharacterized protein YndB with AHSA1/START domain